MKTQASWISSSITGSSYAVTLFKYTKIFICNNKALKKRYFSILIVNRNVFKREQYADNCKIRKNKGIIISIFRIFETFLFLFFAERKRLQKSNGGIKK